MEHKGDIGRIGLAYVALFVFIALLSIAHPAEATGSSHHSTDADLDVAAAAEAAAKATGGDATAKATSGDSVADAASTSNATNEGIATTTNTDTSVYALSLEFPNLVGCIGGGQGGINDRGKGGFLGLNWTNVACWMQQLSESEEDLDIRARLKCGDKHYRRAINLGDRTGTIGEEMERCIGFVRPRWRASIEAEREAAKRYGDELIAARQKLEAAENRIDLLERHEIVCKESLERCEEKAYGDGK